MKHKTFYVELRAGRPGARKSPNRNKGDMLSLRARICRWRPARKLLSWLCRELRAEMHTAMTPWLSTATGPRNPEESPLYGVVAGNLETFLARQRERDRNVPIFVEREFREFLECGVLARGFLRVHCDACGLDRLVPFSCKNRGFCNSCGGRRIADTAAHLVDRVFPRVPVRQWVLSLPYALRYRLAYDARMVSDVLRVFTKTVFASLIRRASEFGARRNAQCGAVAFIQRFGSALNLNLHLHVLVIDGVYAADDDGNPQFQPLLAPEDQEIARLTASLAESIPKLLQRRGLGPESDPEELILSCAISLDWRASTLPLCLARPHLVQTPERA